MMNKCLFASLKSVVMAIFFVGLMLAEQNTLAVEQVRGLSTDSRIKEVAYQQDNVVPVHASPFTTTQIVFGHGEVIENIQNGDLDAWTVSVQKGLPNMMFLKPTMNNSNTNMTVVSNLHTYYFHLISHEATASEEDDSTYAIHFVYPDQARAKMLKNVRFNKQQKNAILNARKNPRNYNWDYSFNGAHSIMPLHIFDDGRFTYLQLQSGQAVPAIFAVDNASGQEAIVNYRREGQYLVVQEVAPQFTLREGKHHVASIFNNKLIHKLKIRGEV